ncbi:MAG TPA: hypothetical protein PL124_11380, partial [Candidatus Cloacimonadota bacterium]|nr:hypothetical protein [Candidatus Cloacimonadota bacterium]
AVDMTLYPNITDTQLNLAGINLAGAIILIIDGPGETELNPWRKIVSNTYDGKVSVDTPWKIAQTSATTFVILDTNIWTEINSTGLDKPVTDVAVVNDMVIFAMGDAHELVYMNESNVAGTWRRAFKADTTVEDGVTGRKADLLEPIVNETGELYLWRARSDGAKVDCAYMTSVTYDMINNSSNYDYMTFDINRKERAAQQLIITRAAADIEAENTKKSRTVIDDKLALTRAKEDAQLAADRASTDYARILALTAADKDDVLISLARTHDDAQITMDRCDADIAYDNGDHPDPEKITSLTRAHDDAVTVKARAAEDEATENAKANPDDGYITSLQRAQIDAQLSHDRITSDIAFEHARTDTAYQLSLTRAKADALLTHNRAVSDTALRVTALLPANDERLLTLDRTYDDALTEVSRDTADLATIDARTDYGSDVGYLTSPARIIEEATWKVSLTAGHESQYLPKYVVCGNTDSRIKNIVPYGTPTIPYIIKEDSIGSILNNIYDEVPIPELRAVRSEYNGIAAMAYGVYLYFVMEGCMIERYYDQRLDDLGPNRADGLPVERMGVIRKLIPYPGRFYAAIDAGPNGYSSILCSNELGWHEIYRMPILGRSITDIVIQTIPGAENPDRLWVGCENTIFKLPIAINPTVQSGYQYYGLAGVQELPYIITSWIDYGMKDINKYFHSVTLFADYPTGTITTGREFEIRVYYRLRENAPWVLAGKAPTPLAARPRSSMGDDVFPQEVELDAKGHNTSGKKIQLKFEFQINTTALNTPRLTAWVLNGVLRMPVKKSWQVTFALEPKKDLQDKILANNYSYLINTISDWANSAKHNTPLVMHTCDVLTDNKLVFIDPASISPINVILEQNQGNNRKQYDHLAQMTLYEV